MSNKRDYYEVLGVGKTASPDEVRKAYRQSALKHHPDRNPGDAEAEAKFKEATEAFQVLSDEEKRARYDRFGHAAFEGGGAPDFGADIFSHFQDIFSEFFGGGGPRRSGGGGQRRGPQRGSDVRVQQRLSLKEALTGCKRDVQLRMPHPCEKCDGSGAKQGTKRARCNACGGVGQVSTARGFVMFTQTCPECQGEGTVVKSPCDACSGSGHVEKSRKVVVAFPAGIDSGQRLRVPGQGMPGAQGGPTGDLFVDVEVAPDPAFERDGLDLATRLHVSVAEAALGATKEIKLPDDSVVSIEIPAGTQPGEVVTARNRGAPRIDGRGRGSLHAVVQVTIPKGLSERATKLLTELEAELRAGESAREGGGREGGGEKAAAEDSDDEDSGEDDASDVA